MIAAVRAELHFRIRNHCVRLPKTLLTVCGLVMLGTGGYANDLPAIKPVASIDLPRFMGKWYVIASIPTHFEKNAYNAVETYNLHPDANVDTTFRFRDGAFDTPVKTIHSTGYVKDGTGSAVWGVQDLGYPRERIRRVPQAWPETSP